MNMKRTIAREGLIIIAISLLLVIVLYLNGREQGKKLDYEKKAEVVEIVEVEKVVAESDEQYQKLKAAGFSDQEITAYYSKAGPGKVKEIERLKSTGLYVMLQKPTDLLRMKETLKKDFPKLINPSFVAWDDQSRSATIARYYDNHGSTINFRNYDAILFAVILLYPAYLIVRFIMWAVKTLRQ